MRASRNYAVKKWLKTVKSCRRSIILKVFFKKGGEFFLKLTLNLCSLQSKKSIRDAVVVLLRQTDFKVQISAISNVFIVKMRRGAQGRREPRRTLRRHCHRKGKGGKFGVDRLVGVPLHT